MYRHYKKWVALLNCLTVLTATYAQQAKPQVVAIAGGSSQAISGFTIDYTVGETIILTAGTDPICTQGFLQPLTAKDYPEIPLELWGTNKKTFIQLAWTTTTETDNAWFYIERSADGVLFSVIDSVFTKAPNGNSTAPLNYQYADLKPLTGVNYYRLRQLRKNSFISYSETIQVNFTGAAWRVRIYPNPVQNTLYMNLFSDKNTMVRIYVTSATGQLVLRKYIELPQGYSIQTLQLGSLASGMYILSVRELFTERRLNVKLIKE